MADIMHHATFGVRCFLCLTRKIYNAPIVGIELWYFCFRKSFAKKFYSCLPGLRLISIIKLNGLLSWNRQGQVRHKNYQSVKKNLYFLQCEKCSKYFFFKYYVVSVKILSNIIQDKNVFFFFEKVSRLIFLSVTKQIFS